MTHPASQNSLIQTPGIEKPLQAVRAAFTELWRYKWLIPAVGLLVAGLVTFWVVRQPKVYEATTTLEYDPHPSQPLGSAMKEMTGDVTFWETREVYQTQNVLLRSRSLAERIVRKLNLHKDAAFFNVPPEKRAEFEGVSVEKAAESLANRIEVAPVRDTRLIRLRVRDSDPERAALLVNTVAETYIDKSLEDRLDTSGRALEWLGTQLQNLKGELEVSEMALYNFREENHSLSASLEERQKILTNQLQQYSEAITMQRTERIRTEARLTMLRDAMVRLRDDPLALRSETIARDHLIANLDEDHRKATSELARLTIVYGDTHPQVRAARSQAQVTIERMHRQIEALIAGVETEVKEQRNAEQGLQKALDEVNRQGLELSLQEVQYTRLDRDRKAKSNLYNLVVQRVAETDLTRALRVANARIVDRAVIPGVPVSPRVQLSIMIGAVFGLALGFAAAFAAGQLDNKVRTTADVDGRGVTVIGVMPSVETTDALAPTYYGRRGRAKKKKKTRVPDSDRDLIVHLEPRSSAAECCRTIRTNLTFQSADRPLRILAVGSARPQDGKTTVVISVAITLAQGGRKVLIIDGDLRRPRLKKAFKVPSGVGLTSVLAGESVFDEAIQATDVPNLSLMQCGPIPPNPSELLHSRRFGEVLEQASQRFDIVVIDTPPLGAVTDPAIIATHADGTLLVVRSRRTTRASLDAAIRQLRGVSARIVGAVVNDVDLTSSTYGDYYAYYRGGYYVADEHQDPPAPGTQATSGG